MGIERQDLKSVTYWQNSPDRVAQRFYVAFCLLMSSIQDSLLGRKEQGSNNLNWSATCSYYSLVHTGRFVCFLALGDYPRQHAGLRQFLASEISKTRQHAVWDGYPFDWLRSFTNDVPRGRGERVDLPVHHLRDMMVTYLDGLGVENAKDNLDRLSILLDNASPLRNDSNYESLLIAHEYRHVIVSEAFSELAEHMASAAESVLPFAIQAFNGYRSGDAALATNQEAYEAFLHEYVHARIEEAIRLKIKGIAPLEHKLEGYLARIASRPSSAPIDDLEQDISLALFHDKSRLMRGFQDRVAALGRAIVHQPAVS